MDDHTLPWLVDLLRARLADMGKRDKTLTLKFCKAGAEKLLESLEDANYRLEAMESRGIDTGMGPADESGEDATELDSLADFPAVVDCKPGLWVELTNGWIVGPIVGTEYSGVYVGFAAGVWQLDVRGDSNVKPPDINATRLARKVGTREELASAIAKAKGQKS